MITFDLEEKSMKTRLEIKMKTISVPDIFPASWKSTLVGVGSAVIAVIQASSYHGDWLAAIHDRSVQMAIVVAILGWVTKDSQVTGGRIGQPSTPDAVEAANQAPSPINPPEPKK